MKRLSRTLLFKTALSNFVIILVLCCILLLGHTFIHHHSLLHSRNSNPILLEDLLLFTATSFIAALCTSIFLTVNLRFHMRDLSSLIGTARKVRECDMTARCSVGTSDETGRLAMQFNDMLDHIDTINRTLEEKVRKQTAQLEESNRNYRETQSRMNDLLTFKRHLSSLSGRLLTEPMASMPARMHTELDSMHNLFRVDFIALFLASDNNDSFHLIDQAIHSGEPVPLFPESASMLMSLESVLRHGETIIYDSLDSTLFTDFADANDLFRRIGIKAMAAVPLQINNRVAGAIIVGNRNETYWPEALPGRIKLCGEVLAGAWIRYRSETDLSRSRDRLRALAMELSGSEERQSDRLATWIHDKIGQELALVKIRLGMAQQSCDVPAFQDEISALRESVDSIISECRERVLDLAPPILHELGPGPAIEWCAHRIVPANGPQLSLSITTDGATLPHTVATVLFRCARELMINVIKHAHAEHLTLSLHANGTAFVLTVEDDGIGLPASILSHPGSGEGFGLMNCSERIEDLGGSLDLSRRSGGGTIARLVFTHSATATTSITTEEAKETIHAGHH